MKTQSMPKGFSGFTWAIAIFCFPILLCPMALLLSTAFSKNPSLSDWQINLFSTLFWSYPLILAVLARFFYKLHFNKPILAKKLLAGSFILFYISLITICIVGFN